MAFTRLTDDLDVIQKLPDLPNDTGGLSADQLKAKYDEAANVIKDYINSTLLEQLEGENGAPSIGITPIENIDATTAQRALEILAEMIKQAVIGSIPDHSITDQQLANDAVTTANIASSAVTGDKIADGAVTDSKIVAISGNKVTGLSIGTSNIIDKSVTTAKIADFSVSSAKIAGGSIVNEKLGDNAVSTSKVANNAITRGKLADNAASDFYDVVVGTGWSNTAPFTISVTVNGLTAADKPMVGLIASDNITTAMNQVNAMKYVYKTVATAANTLKLYAFQKPTVALPIRVFVARK